MDITLHFLSIFFRAIVYILPIVLFLALLISVGGVILAKLDNMPLPRALYMAFITALTIGYGDYTPKHPAGRVVAIFLGIIGVTFTGIIVAVAVFATHQSLDIVFGVQALRK